MKLHYTFIIFIDTIFFVWLWGKKLNQSKKKGKGCGGKREGDCHRLLFYFVGLKDKFASHDRLGAI